MIDSVVLTGGSGFLGAALLKIIADGNREIYALSRAPGQCTRYPGVKWIDWNDLRKVTFPSHSAFIHLATSYGGSDAWPSQIVEANLLRPLDVMEKMKGEIACVFAADSWWSKSTPETSPRVSYTATKKAFGAIGGEVAKEFGIPFFNGMIEQMYGPSDKASKSFNNLMVDIIANLPALNLSDGNQRRDFIHVQDVASAICKLIDNFSIFQPGLCGVGIGSGQSHTISEVLLLLKQISQSTTVLNFGKITRRNDELQESVADISVLSRLGWQPQMDLATGLRSLVA